MVLLSSAADDREGYYYDEGTGMLTIKSTKFSPFTIIFDKVEQTVENIDIVINKSNIDGTEVPTLQGKDVVVSAEETKISEAITIKGDVVLNLNGTLDASTIAGRPFAMTDGSSLTINANGNEIKMGSYGLVNIPEGVSADVTLNGGTYTSNMNNGSVIKPRGNGKINIIMNNVIVEDESDDSFIIATETYVGKDLFINVNGGSFTVNRGFSQTAGTATVRNAEFNVATVGYSASHSANATIENCTFNVTGTGDLNSPNTAVTASMGGTVTVNNCTINSAQHALAIYSGASKINANNCVVCVTGDYDAYAIYDGNANYPITDAQINVNGMEFVASNAEGLVAAAKVGGEVTLTSDIELPEQLEVKGNLVINGGEGHTLTAPKGGTRVINVSNNTEDVVLELVGVTLAAVENERGISFYNNTGVLNVTLDDCVVEAEHYGINVASGNTEAILTVKNSTLKGYAAFQTWSAKTVANFDNCTLTGVNKWDDPTEYPGVNDFAVIVINDGADDCVVNFNNCVIEAISEGTATEFHYIDKAENTAINWNNCTFKVNGNAVNEATTKK